MSDQSPLIVPLMPSRRHFLSQMAVLGAGALTTPLTLAQVAGQAPLQTQLNQLVQQMRAQRLISPIERTSWSIYDFTSREKLVSINEEVPMQAASLLKPFVAQAFFYTSREQGARLPYTSAVRDLMVQMIQRSGNDATNELMRIVSRYNGNNGPQDVERVLKRWAGGVFQQTKIVEFIPPGGRTYLNQASARDYSRFLYALWHNQMPQAREVLDIMGLPNNNRSTRGVPSMPADVRNYHKTGSTAMLCGTMGIIVCNTRRGGEHAYTYIGIIERSQRTDSYTTWITARSNVLRSVSNLVCLYMRDRYPIV